MLTFYLHLVVAKALAFHDNRTVPGKRKKNLALVPPPEALPDYIANSPLLQKSKLSSKGLARYQEQMLLLFTPLHFRTWCEQMWTLLKQGDMAAMRLYAETMRLIDSKGGVSIINNIQQNNLGNGNAQGYQFDRVVRELSQQEKLALSKVPETIDVH